SSLLPSQVPLRLSISAYFLKIQALMQRSEIKVYLSQCLYYKRGHIHCLILESEYLDYATLHQGY
ncbi:hypothetical protein, partial [Legionella donaldsonii]|uniref:hypothetical protein n=1 Tax=Legionella donaldsonii TaxID=45060 RepID=UPI00399C6686